MNLGAHDIYLESSILSAEPVELIRLLYRACTTEVREARRHLAAGDIMARTRSISKACEILMELTGSLDHENGGEISQRLMGLYDYIQRRLIEANFRQSEAPLAEVLGLLSTLAEAWDGLKVQRQVEDQVQEERQPQWAPPPETAGAYASNAWSF